MVMSNIPFILSFCRRVIVKIKKEYEVIMKEDESKGLFSFFMSI